jgi:hypothetical protein
MRYWVRLNKQTYGPFGLGDLKKVPGLGPDTMVAAATGPTANAWRAVKAVPELGGLLRSAEETVQEAELIETAPAPKPAAGLIATLSAHKLAFAMLATAAGLVAYALTAGRRVPEPAPVAPAAEAVPAPATTAPLPGRFGLDWQRTPYSPLRSQMEECRAVDSLDMLILFYGLSRQSPAGGEFDAYFPEVKRAKGGSGLSPEIARKLTERAAQLKSAALCAKLPDAAHPVAAFEDRSASGGGKSARTGLAFANASDADLFPTPAAVKEAHAASAYAVFRPASAQSQDVVVKGKSAKRKLVLAKALGLVLVSDKGLVLAAYHSDEPAPKPAAPPAAVVEATTTATTTPAPEQAAQDPMAMPVAPTAPAPAPSATPAPGAAPAATPAPAPDSHPDAIQMTPEELEKYLSGGAKK